MKLYAVHLPPGIEDLPTIKTYSKNIFEFQKSIDEFEGLNWGKINVEFNARVVDRFIELLSAQDVNNVKSGNLVGIVWVYEPTALNGSVSVPYVQVIVPRNDLETYFGSEMATESELEFFEAI
jgi:hypothetical protein